MQYVGQSCEPFFPLQHSKRPRTPICPKFVPTIFLGVPIKGAQSCQKFVEKLKICPEIVVFQFFDKFLTNLGPPDWNPEKQSSGQILDKFGVQGLFECCKGKKGSQGQSSIQHDLQQPNGTKSLHLQIGRQTMCIHQKHDTKRIPSGTKLLRENNSP